MTEKAQNVLKIEYAEHCLTLSARYCPSQPQQRVFILATSLESPTTALDLIGIPLFLNSISVHAIVRDNDQAPDYKEGIHFKCKAHKIQLIQHL